MYIWRCSVLFILTTDILSTCTAVILCCCIAAPSGRSTQKRRQKPLMLSLHAAAKP